jgi:hypothetical protein
MPLTLTGACVLYPLSTTPAICSLPSGPGPTEAWQQSCRWRRRQGMGGGVAPRGGGGKGGGVLSIYTSTYSISPGLPAGSMPLQPNIYSINSRNGIFAFVCCVALGSFIDIYHKVHFCRLKILLFYF